MLVLETVEMKFSVVVDLPAECDCRLHTVVDAGEGRIGLLILGTRMLFLYSKSWPNNGDGVKDWRYDNAIPLVDHHWPFIGGAEGYALLKGYRKQIIEEESCKTQYFIAEIKTLSVRRLCAMKPATDGPCYLYSSFPVPLSLPSL